MGDALFALAALSAAFAVTETAGQALPPGFVPSAATWASAAGLAVAVTAYALLRSAPGLVAAWGMSAFLVGFGVQEVVHEFVGPGSGGGFSPIGSQTASSAAGTGLLLLGAAGIALAAVGVLREQGTAVGIRLRHRAAAKPDRPRTAPDTP